ncbi:MAG: hypothetical protein M0P33_00175 [Massilibacteroides sp.]|nr:hypothetical protein [Massilibacteroides sp.]
MVDADYILMTPDWLAKEVGISKESLLAWLESYESWSLFGSQSLAAKLEKTTGIFEEAWECPEEHRNSWREIWKRKIARIRENQAKGKRRPPL